jgi:hypothetical protein
LDSQNDLAQDNKDFMQMQKLFQQQLMSLSSMVQPTQMNGLMGGFPGQNGFYGQQMMGAGLGNAAAGSAQPTAFGMPPPQSQPPQSSSFNKLPTSFANNKTVQA